MLLMPDTSKGLFINDEIKMGLDDKSRFKNEEIVTQQLEKKRPWFRGGARKVVSGGERLVEKACVCWGGGLVIS